MASRSPYDAKTYPYDRPQMPWRCGDPLQDCRQGPDGRGRCQGGAVCIPLKNDDSWRCGRPRAAGGNCEQGPDGEGNCGLELSRCTPTPSRWLQRRRAFKWGTFLFVCALLFSTTGDRFSSFFNPGDLHAHHVRNSCVDCHNAELEEPFAFIHLGLGFDRGDHGMTDRCLVCHQLGDQGSNPHSVSFARLRMSRKRILDDLPGLSSLLPPDPPAEMMISCARCHPQHHGEMEPTTILSDSGCQSCHGRKFSSFSEGHPEFGSELGRLPRSIKFNHADHFSRHFEENTENAKKNCNGCHELDSDTQTFGYRSYEQSCKNCHEQEIASWEGTTGEPGFEVIGIPQIDFETLRGADLSIGDWPQQGEEELSPWVQNLLASIDGGRQDLELLRGVSLYDLEEAPETVLLAVHRTAWRLKSSLGNALDEDVSTIFRQLAGDPNATIPEVDFAPMAGALSHQLLAEAVGSWFPRLSEELKRRQAGLPPLDRSEPDETKQADDPSGDDDTDLLAGDDDEDLLAGDDDSDLLAGDDDEDQKSDSSDGDENVKPGDWTRYGGWYRSNETLRYRPTGHQDPTIVAWIEAAAAGGSDPVSKEILTRLLDENAPGRCGSCHVITAENARHRLERGALWKPEVAPRQTGFTRFSHIPHVVINSGLDCRDCHQFSEIPAPSGTPDHMAVTRGACIECHGQQIRQGCTTCHPYHVEKPEIHTDTITLPREG